MASAAKAGVRLGAINPNVFQTRFTERSLGNPDPKIRQAALVTFWKALSRQADGQRDVSLWSRMAPVIRHAIIRHRKQWLRRVSRRTRTFPHSACWWNKPLSLLYTTDLAVGNVVLSRVSRSPGEVLWIQGIITAQNIERSSRGS